MLMWIAYKATYILLFCNQKPTGCLSILEGWLDIDNLNKAETAFILGMSEVVVHEQCFQKQK